MADPTGGVGQVKNLGGGGAVNEGRPLPSSPGGTDQPDLHGTFSVQIFTVFFVFTNRTEGVGSGEETAYGGRNRCRCMQDLEPPLLTRVRLLLLSLTAGYAPPVRGLSPSPRCSSEPHSQGPFAIDEASL